LYRHSLIHQLMIFWILRGVVDQCSEVSEENTAFNFMVTDAGSRVCCGGFGGRGRNLSYPKVEESWPSDSLWLGMARLRAPTLLHNRHIAFLPNTFATTLISILKMEAVLFFRNVGLLIRYAASHSLFVLYDYSACDMCQSCLDRLYSRNSEVMTCFIALVNCDGRTLSRRILQVKIRDRTF
jgi:hypothetical protein